ncbi:uncharacterized protein G2W53_039977 [Senna tora]|uniref:Uncharacterized protein n=1 Tax=Senna tora TaxID=362788 RepID=A0A834W6L7_9FABA|nr:uncharacterized protein G2W53_039977 [Senna tora]
MWLALVFSLMSFTVMILLASLSTGPLMVIFFIWLMFCGGLVVKRTDVGKRVIGFSVGCLVYLLCLASGGGTARLSSMFEWSFLLPAPLLCALVFEGTPVGILSPVLLLGEVPEIGEGVPPHAYVIQFESYPLGASPSGRRAPPYLLPYVPLPGLFLPEGVSGWLVWDISSAANSLLIQVVNTRSRFTFPPAQLVQGLGYVGVFSGRLGVSGDIWVYTRPCVVVRHVELTFALDQFFVEAV